MTAKERLESILAPYKPMKEFRFHLIRRWRFDYAWSDRKIAIEYEGGVFIRGGHTRGGHYVQDCEKYRAAQLLGWRVFRYTAKDLDRKKRLANTIEEIREILEVKS